jgi:hypothetical protein
MVTLWRSHPITWFSKQQSIVTTSTTEAEFVASAMAAKEGLWLRKLLSEPLIYAREFDLLCDNEAAISLMKNKSAGVSGRTKHIDIQHMFVRERHTRRKLTVKQIESAKQFDMFTKVMPSATLHAHLLSIGMRAHADV